MRRHRRPRTHRAGPVCRPCLGSGRVPFPGNHFGLWMVPCPTCRDGAPPLAA